MLAQAGPAFKSKVWKEMMGSSAPQSLPILLYHKVDRRFEWGGTWVTPSQFESQIRFLLQNDYRFCTLERLVERCPPGEPSSAASVGSAGKLVAITFDDGYLALKDFAFPILRHYRVPASVFVVTEFVGKENLWDVNLGRRKFEHLTWSDIETASAEGIRFYSHTATHRDLTRLPEKDLAAELLGSRETLERRIPGRACYLSYPFGIYNAMIAEVARDCGYEGAFTLFRRKNEVVDPLYCIERKAVYRIDTLGCLRRKLGGGMMAGVEELKGRGINWCARGTPVAKSLLMRLRGNSPHGCTEEP